MDGKLFLEFVALIYLSILTKYIKLYEENTVYDRLCLFHDFRTKYLDSIEIVQSDEMNMPHEIL